MTAPAIEFVLDGDVELRAVQRALVDAEAHPGTAGEHLAELHHRFDAIDGYSARARAASLLSGLGFTSARQDDLVASFSGGWRMRLNLAQALMTRSDLLLLDEPTNHLRAVRSGCPGSTSPRPAPARPGRPETSARTRPAAAARRRAGRHRGRGRVGALGERLDERSAPARGAAASTSSRLASGRPKPMLSATDPANMTFSWVTMTTARRRSTSDRSRRSTPSRVTRPCVGSSSRARQAGRWSVARRVVRRRRRSPSEAQAPAPATTGRLDVAEAHTLESAPRRARAAAGPGGWLDDARLLLQHAGQLLQRRRGGLERVEELADVLHRLEEQPQVEQERGQHTDRHVALEGPRPP